jgi:hypothetical protein
MFIFITCSVLNSALDCFEMSGSAQGSRETSTTRKRQRGGRTVSALRKKELQVMVEKIHQDIGDEKIPEDAFMSMVEKEGINSFKERSYCRDYYKSSSGNKILKKSGKETLQQKILKSAIRQAHLYSKAIENAIPNAVKSSAKEASLESEEDFGMASDIESDSDELIPKRLKTVHKDPLEFAGDVSFVLRSSSLPIPQTKFPPLFAKNLVVEPWDQIRADEFKTFVSVAVIDVENLEVLFLKELPEDHLIFFAFGENLIDHLILSEQLVAYAMAKKCFFLCGGSGKERADNAADVFIMHLSSLLPKIPVMIFSGDSGFGILLTYLKSKGHAMVQVKPDFGKAIDLPSSIEKGMKLLAQIAVEEPKTVASTPSGQQAALSESKR